MDSIANSDTPTLTLTVTALPLCQIDKYFLPQDIEPYLGVGVLLEEALQLPEADLAVLLAGAAQLEDGLQLRLVRHRRHLRISRPSDGFRERQSEERNHILGP